MLTILDQVCLGGRAYWLLQWEGCPVVRPFYFSALLPLYGSVDFQEPLGRAGSELGVRQR